jgi:hypothetical protein
LEVGDETVIKFNYRDITSISHGSKRVLICSSACSSLYDPSDWSKICDLQNRDGTVFKSISSNSGSHFATIHHETRAVQLWRGKDGKLVWKHSFNHVPSCMSFSPGVGQTALQGN